MAKNLSVPPTITACLRERDCVCVSHMTQFELRYKPHPFSDSIKSPGVTYLLMHHATGYKGNRMTSLDMMNKNKIDRETMERKSDSVIPILEGMYTKNYLYKSDSSEDTSVISDKLQ